MIVYHQHNVMKTEVHLMDWRQNAIQTLAVKKKDKKTN